MASTSPVLVLNAGSSSLKYLLAAGPAFRDHVRGVVEHIGEAGGPTDHGAAFDEVFRILEEPMCSHPPVAVGHRVVHGGERFHGPARLDEQVIRVIDAARPLAPVHNPAALAVINAALAALDVPQVAVFDTAFHNTLTAEARAYAIDREVATEFGIRRYGFHGISVRDVRDRTAGLMRRPAGELNLIVLHLGNGASATAIERGASVDTSMGMTPLEGLVMGTRAGDLDPAITFHLLRSGWTPEAVERMYERESGLTGLCGENDMRAVDARARAGDAAAEHAIAVYCRRIRKYVGAYYAVLGHVDAIVFTAGVGEHSSTVRARVLGAMGSLGVDLDPEANAVQDPGAGRLISTAASKVAVYVVPTDEERAIAVETGDLLKLDGW